MPRLTRIVINEALTRVRSRTRFPELDIASVLGENSGIVFISRARDPERQAADSEMRDALARALNALPAKYRTVFTMRAVHEMSVSESAQRLGLSGECIKARLHRARTMLRQRLDRRVGPVARSCQPAEFEQRAAA